MSIRPYAIVLVAALGLAGAGPGGSKTAPPTIRTQPTFFISGHGWGHGLGMSQYGAYGYAQHGWTYDRIVKHYYTGTTIGQAPVSRVRVLLADKAKRVTIASKLPFQVVDGSGSKHALAAGSYTVGAGFKYADPADPQAKPTSLAYPLEFRPGATAVALDGSGPGPVPELAGDSVSRLRPRSLRLDLAVPRLGPISLHGAQARPGPEVAGQAARCRDRRRPLGSGAGRRRHRLEGRGNRDRL